MPPQAQTSFIPKKPLDTAAPRRPAGASSLGFFFFIGLFVFLVSLVGAGGVFAYKTYVEQSIQSKSDSLAKAEAAFDINTIQDLIRLDSRIKNARTLLASHVAPSAIFAFLSQQTLQSVQFSNFNYTLDEEGGAKITMQGQADNFSSVALQSDQFGASKVLKDVIFSGIQTSATGRVTFAVAATVDPSLINFSKNLGNPATQPVIETTPVPTQTTSTPAPAAEQ